MGQYETNIYPGLHYQAGVLKEVKHYHHNDAKSIDDTGPVFDGQDYLACYDAGAAAGKDGSDFLTEAATYGTGAGSYHDWMDSSDRGAKWIDDEILKLPRPE